MQTDAPSAEPPNRKRRWFQFSLRTLMIVVTVFAVVCGDISANGSLDARIAKLIEAIDDNPDELHYDYTPAARGLIEVGRPAIAPLLPLMLYDSRYTRRHAQRAIEGITMEMMGFRFGQGWNKPESETRWEKFWDSLGRLRSEASIDERRQSVAKWREWLERRETID
jgi:hypothetical protein